MHGQNHIKFVSAVFSNATSSWKDFSHVELKVGRLHEEASVREILNCFDTNMSHYVDFCTIYYTFNGFSSCESYTILS